MIQGSPKQKRVIFYINSMAGGGAERTVVELLQNLNRGQFTPYLALSRVRGDYLSLIPDDVPILDLSAYVGKANLIRRIWRLKEVVDEFHPHLIVASLESPNCSLLRTAPLIRHRCRLLVTQQNNLSLNLQRRHKGIMQLAKTLEIKTLYKWADRVIAVSNGVKDDLVNNFGVAESRVTTIYNPVDVHKVQAASRQEVEIPWDRSDEHATILAVGRLVEEKAFDDLIRAFAKVRREIACRLLILGEGELRPRLMALVNELGVQKDVYLPGFVKNPWAYMRMAELYVSTSHTEGSPLTLVEALASGIPVLATDCDFGPREIINPGINGVLVPVGDIDAIATNVIELLSSASKRKVLAEAGKERAHAFDTKVITQHYEDLFCDLTR